MYFVLGISAMGWSLWISQRMLKRDLLKSTTLPPPFGLLDFFVAFFLLFASQVSIVLVSQIATNQTYSEATTAGARAMVFALAIGLLCLSYWIRQNSEKRAWLNYLRLTWRMIGVGLFASVLLIPLVIAIHVAASKFIPYEHVVIDQLANADRETILWTVITTGFLVPVFEEMVFRLTIQGALSQLFAYRLPDFSRWVLCSALTNEERANCLEADGESAAKEKNLEAEHRKESKPLAPSTTRLAGEASQLMPRILTRSIRTIMPVLVSSTLFASMHLGQGAAPIPLFVLAVGLGWLMQRTGSLIPCIIVHMLLNNWSLANLLLTNSAAS
jgi:membrane protease YdiL (CAAX protease family)